MQHYACINDVPLLGFGPETSSIFIGMQLSPKRSRTVARVLYQCRWQSSATNFCIFNICRFLASHWHVNEIFETEQGKGISSGASNEEIDGKVIFCLGNKGLLDLVKQQARREWQKTSVLWASCELKGREIMDHGSRHLGGCFMLMPAYHQTVLNSHILTLDKT